MSRETEKVFREFQKFLDENMKDNMTENDIDVLAKLFFEQHNMNLPDPVTHETAETADDWLELAEEADSDEEALKCARKALRLEPDNLDAERMVIQYGELEELEKLKALKLAVARGTEQMKREGLLEKDTIGKFWGVLETRPYMRLRRAYMDALTDLGMLGRAAEEGADMLKLSTADNLGVRYSLMHIYVQLEREKEALELHHLFEDSEETQMLLPLSMLYFKKEDWKTAEKYLRRLEKANPDTRKFMQAMKNGTVNKFFEEMEGISYRPGTIDEFLLEIYENGMLFAGQEEYFEWAHKVLRKKKK